VKKINSLVKISILLIVSISVINASQSIICKVTKEADIKSIVDRLKIDTKYIKNLGSNLYIIKLNGNESAESISKELSKDRDIIYAQPNETKRVIKR